MNERAIQKANIQEALNHMSTLQDITISSRLLQHTSKYVSDANGSLPLIQEEGSQFQNFAELNVESFIGKRYIELNPQEKVAMMYHLVDK